MNLTTVEADIAAAATKVEHAVAWLLGMAQLAEKDVQTLEAASPLVKDAIIAGAEEVLAMAQQINNVQAPAKSGPTTP